MYVLLAYVQWPLINVPCMDLGIHLNIVELIFSVYTIKNTTKLFHDLNDHKYTCVHQPSLNTYVNGNWYH